MGNVLRIDIIADGRKAASTFDSVGGKAAKLGKGLAVGVGAGVALAGVAVGKLAVDSVKAASDVQQAFGATESVFGKYAGSVQAAAKGAATSVGLASSDYANLANILGSQLKNMGTAAGDLAPKTDALIKQGADLAATFGGTTADAVSAVSSLLKGERDPIERYGVSIKQADINARLAATGQDKLKGAALNSATAQATLALLTQQTSAAQGSFARESDTAAGQQQRLTAQWTNAKAELGAGLLPILTRVATFMTTQVMPAVQSAASALSAKFGPALSAMGPLVTRVGQFITGTLVPAARSLFQWFVTKIAPGIRSAVTPIIAGLRSAFDSVASAVQRNMPQLRTIGSLLKTVAEFIATKVAPVVGKVLGKAFEVVGLALGGFIDGIGSAVDGISSLVGWIKDAVSWIGDLEAKLRGGAIKALNKLPGVHLGLMAAPAPAPAPAPLVGARSLAMASTPAALTSSPSERGLPSLAGGFSSVVETHVHLHIDGAFVGDEAGLARELRRVIESESARFGWARA